MVESLGIERSYQAMADADLTLVVVDLSRPRPPKTSALIERARTPGPLAAGGQQVRSGARRFPPKAPSPVSALTGEGIPTPARAILEAVAPARRASAGDRLHHQPAPRAAAARIRARIWRRRRGAVDGRIPHEMLLLDLYAALRAHRRHHRRHHRRRHSEPHLLDVLHREVMRAAIASSRAIRWSGHRPLQLWNTISSPLIVPL